MIISIYNKKGGVGKTSLSFSLAKDLNYFLISNDDSVIEKVYENKAKIIQEPKLIKNCVYDSNILHIIKESDIVIIPLTSDLNSFKKTISTLEEIDTQKVVFVATRSEKEDFEDIKKYLTSKYDFPLFEIKNSRIWSKTFVKKMSALELKNENSINSYIYRNSINGYIDLLNYIKKQGKIK